MAWVPITSQSGRVREAVIFMYALEDANQRLRTFAACPEHFVTPIGNHCITVPGGALPRAVREVCLALKPAGQ